MNNIPIILAVFPFIVFVFLLIRNKTSLLNVSLITLILYTLLALFFWKIYPSFLLISYIKGFFVAIDILLIIFGAIFFLEVLRNFKVIDNVSYYLSNFSKDYRIQIIVIAWLFEAFLEGTAGFGVPAVVAVPLLIGLGLTPIRALIVGLLGNSTAGVFGAAGAPIIVGLAGLNVSNISIFASLFNGLGLIIPVFMLWIITKDRVNRKGEFFEALPFAIWSGIAFVIPSMIFAHLGPEFPSILGSMVGLILVFITTKFNIFVPKNIRTFNDKKEVSDFSLTPLKTFTPYIILVLFLILGKIFLSGISIPINFGILHNFSIFNPGFAFILSSFLTILLFKNNNNVIKKSLLKGIKDALIPFFVIVSMLAVVQIMTYSGQNSSGYPSAIALISKLFETPLLPFFAPFVSAFGNFLTGSITVSNIMFGNLLSMASNGLGLNPEIILSLGLAGGGASSMIALADILAAEAVVGVKNSEKKILKGVLAPCLLYITIVGVIGLIIFK